MTTRLDQVPLGLVPRGYDAPEVSMAVFADKLAVSGLDRIEQCRIWNYAREHGLDKVVSPPGYATSFLPPTCGHDSCVDPKCQTVTFLPIEEC